jgi:nicotinate-nucleotide--dimethylbenzimidazole phosphoribosyltransferase
MAAIQIGLDVAAAEAEALSTVIGTGEMGIANTTAASAVVAIMTSLPVADVTGRGAGVDDAGHARKVAAIERALALNAPDPRDPIGVLAAVGGFELAALAGLIIGAASARLPVVLDGFITGAAALIAAALCPMLPPRLIASHRSAEAGHRITLEVLGLEPLLDLGLRLGEGTGAALTLGLLDAACAVRDGMATFASAGVASRT